MRIKELTEWILIGIISVVLGLVAVQMRSLIIGTSIVAALGLLVFLVKTHHPDRLMLMVFLASVPFESIVIPAPIMSLSASNILIILATLVAGIRIVQTRAPLRVDAGGILLVLLGFLAVAISWFARDQGQHVRSLVSLMGGVLVYYVCSYSVNSRDDLAVLMRTLWYVVAAVGAWGIIQAVLAYAGVVIGRVDYYYAFNPPLLRVSGTYRDPNAYAYCLLAGLPSMFMAFLSRQQTILPRRRLGILILLAAGGWALSFSRGAWIGMATALAAIVWLWADQLARTMKMVFRGLILTLGAVLLMKEVPQQLASFLIEMNPNSAYTHFDLWMVGLRVITEYPGGVGFQGWTTFSYQQLIAENQKELHNTYLQTGTALGVAGLAIYVAFLGWIATAGLRLRRREMRTLANILGVAAIGLIVGAVFIDVLFTKPLWTIAGLVGGVIKVDRQIGRSADEV